MWLQSIDTICFHQGLRTRQNIQIHVFASRAFHPSIETSTVLGHINQSHVPYQFYHALALTIVIVYLHLSHNKYLGKICLYSSNLFIYLTSAPCHHKFRRVLHNIITSLPVPEPVWRWARRPVSAPKAGGSAVPTASGRTWPPDTPGPRSSPPSACWAGPSPAITWYIVTHHHALLIHYHTQQYTITLVHHKKNTTFVTHSHSIIHIIHYDTSLSHTNYTVIPYTINTYHTIHHQYCCTEYRTLRTAATYYRYRMLHDIGLGKDVRVRTTKFKNGFRSR